jgi:signal transduction histidine kinase/DNA-binding response OmpR family regulator/CHASE3 domain sensor protein
MKSSLKRNLLIGFSASLLILIISSIASFMSIRSLLKSADLVSHTNQVIQGVNEVNRALLDAETGQRGFLLTRDDDFLKPYKDSRNRALNAFAKVRTMTLDNYPQQKNLDALYKLMNDRFHYLDLSVRAVQNGTPVNPDNLRIGKEMMENVRNTIEIISQSENQLLADRTKVMNRFAAFTSPSIIVAALIALLITMLFYKRVRADLAERLRLQQALSDKDQEITERIHIIQGIADKVSQGRYDIRINDKQSDALGNVAGSLNKMAESLQYSFGLLSDKEWLQTGIAKLHDVMIGDKDVTALCKDVMEIVATYTNSNAGAIYLLEGSELHAAAGFAYDPVVSRQTIKVGEGILGQSIVTRKPIELKDIPSENISISFAAGEVKPKHVIALPISNGYAVKGALELASLNSFTSREIEFLVASTPNIGIAISSSQNRRKLQQLLEETQAQSEELQAQHAELENLNSELELQSERLQASEEELKVQQEELKQANEELEERSSLLEEKNQIISENMIEMQKRAEQLEQSTRYKSEFLANMSHELRTPLNSILLLARLMSENPEKNLTEGQVEYTKVIQSSGNGLLSLIDEILDLSKIEAGKMDLEYQTVSILELIQDMHTMFSPLASDKNIELRTSISENVPATIETDKLKLEQIIRNLLSNAIKFTAQGYVSLSVEKSSKLSSNLEFRIKDTGIGIPKEKQSLVFDAFKQADGSTRRKFGGTGLGLSISRELVTLLGGRLTVSSEVNKGSEFTISIPIAHPIPSNKGAKKIDESVVHEAAIEMPSSPKYISTHIPAGIEDDRNQIGEGDKVMLIIEDDTNFAKSLMDFTRKRGYKCIVGVRGDEGIELAKQFSPIGILLDVQLPVKSGWQVMEELKTEPETRHIPVHIMSSFEVKKESLLKGAVDFVSKPVAFEQMTEIFKKIEYVLNHHPKKVLIVEENARHAMALAYFLESFDVNLEIKSDVKDAVKILQNKDVDCVILDMGIPDPNSYRTLEVVKETPGLENLPIIIFTGKILSQSEELKIKQYADSIVVKTAHSYRRILDEVSLFLHMVGKNDKQEISSPKHHKLGTLDEVLKNRTVLIADDDMRNIFSMTRALEKYEMKVVAAIDGIDALEKLKNNADVDIVLMDMMMPQMDGYETIKAIRQNRRYKNLPIIAVTAKAMMGDREKCINAGASDYITKPVDIDQLFSLLRVWLYEKAKKL